MSRGARVACGHGQEGVALVMVMVVLLIVTLLGLAAMRGTIMQERMSSNVQSRALAFQSAENVLREVESNLAVGGRPAGMPPAGGGCVAGLCGMPQNGAAPAWQAANFWTSGAGFASSLDVEEDMIKRFVIEDIGDGRSLSAGCTTGIDLSASTCEDDGASSRNYRITAFVRIGNGAEVLLQSVYQVP